jgi:hypothetical protein
METALIGCAGPVWVTFRIDHHAPRMRVQPHNSDWLSSKTHPQLISASLIAREIGRRLPS